jgi:tetratricopeptide (TPR) repeat protein
MEHTTKPLSTGFLTTVLAIAAVALGGCGGQPTPATPEDPGLVAAAVTPPTATATLPPTVTFTPLPPLTATPTPAPTYDPGEAGPPYERGNRAFAEADYVTAVNEYTQAIRLRDDFAGAYYNRGLSHTFLGRMEEALADLTEAIELEPTRADAYVARARVYLEAGNTQVALMDLNEAIYVDPDYVTAYLDRGQFYEERGELEAALGDYNTFVSLASANPQGFYRRGTLRLDLGDAEGALIDLTVALCLQDSERDDCQGTLIDTTLAAGFFAEYPQALYARGAAYAALDQHSLAAHDFEEAIQLGLETSEVFRELGLAYFQIGELESAGGSLIRATELDAESFAAHYSLTSTRHTACRCWASPRRKPDWASMRKPCLSYGSIWNRPRLRIRTTSAASNCWKPWKPN